MAAGQGFKTFNTGDVLTASDVNGYLMQGVWVFDDATARTAAVTSPEEGNFSYLKDTNKLYYYTGSAWAEADTSGILPSSFTAKGDILVGTGSGTFDDLTVGTNGHVLTADSSTSTGVKWAAPGGGAGLTFISRTSWSSASSHTVDNVFTSTYSAYLIVIEDWISNAFANLPQIQLRYGSTTQTAGYYGSSFGTAFSSSTLLYEGTDNASAFDFWRYSGEAHGTFISAYIERVGTGSSIDAVMTGHGMVNTNAEQYKFGMRTTNARNYTGFVILQSAGTSSGTVTVYGLAKA